MTQQALPTLRFLAIVVGCLLFLSTLSAMASETSDKLITESKTAAAAGDLERATELATQAIAAERGNATWYLYRGTLYESQRKHKEAVSDFGRVIELSHHNADAFDHRGSERFKLGLIAESIDDFDEAISLDPRREPGHWKRGISYYYAGRYDDGRQQFEGYQTVDGNDVENAVWRFLCMARKDGVQKARGDLLKIKHDRRVPMMEIYALYSGKATSDDVMAAVRAGEPGADELRHRQFYAELYLGLYDDALGNKAAAMRHLEAAVDNKIGHYMWDVAKVHRDLLVESDER